MEKSNTPALSSRMSLLMNSQKKQSFSRESPLTVFESKTPHSIQTVKYHLDNHRKTVSPNMLKRSSLDESFCSLVSPPRPCEQREVTFLEKNNNVDKLSVSSEKIVGTVQLKTLKNTNVAAALKNHEIIKNPLSTISVNDPGETFRKGTSATSTCLRQ